MSTITRYNVAAEINRQTDLSKQIASLQQQVSSGKRLSAPSDDPAAAARIAQIRQSQADQTIYTSNVNTGIAIASAADTSLSSVATLLNRAKDLLLSGRNDTSSTTDRSSVANEIRGLATTLQTYATATDPTGAALFPDNAPLNIPVSDTLNLPATASRASVFDGVSVTTTTTDPTTNVSTTTTTTQSLTDILNAAADALETTDPTQLATLSDASLSAIDDGVDHITQVQADQGVRAQRFDQAQATISSDGDALTTERSTLEDTDLTYALSQFQAKQLSLQAAQTVFAQSMKNSLFDRLG